MRDKFNRAADVLTKAMGSPLALAAAGLVIVVWAVTGPIFHFSDTWQLVINTGTTIVTFLMVFVIQNSQNRNSKALHLKIDELIRALDEARNDFVTVEQASDEELQAREDEMTALAQDVAIEVGGPKAEETVRRVERRVARTSPSAARGERSKSTRPTGGRSNGRSHRAKAGAADTSAKADKAGKVGKGT